VVCHAMQRHKSGNNQELNAKENGCWGKEPQRGNKLAELISHRAGNTLDKIFKRILHSSLPLLMVA